MKVKMMTVALGLALVGPQVMAQSGAKEIKAKVVKREDSAKETTKTATEANAASSSEGSKMVCSHGDLERHVEIEYEDPTTKVPCKVHYRKTSEDPNHHQILWTANSDAAYCESKTQEFVAKLEGWGWTCKADQ